MPVSVLESNSRRDVIDVASLWSARQAAAASASVSLPKQDTSTLPPLLVQAATNAPLSVMNDIIPGSVIDGVTLVIGDVVLLTAQNSALQNGPWVVTATSPRRPADYSTTCTRLYYVTRGIAFRGTLYVGNASVYAVLARCGLRDPVEERSYLNSLGISASTLTGRSTADDAQNREYLEALRLRATVLAGPTLPAEDAQTTAYLNTLPLRANVLFGSTSADDDQNTTYLRGLPLNATRLLGWNTLDNEANRFYLRSIGVANIEPVIFTSQVHVDISGAVPSANIGSVQFGGRVLLTAQTNSVDNGVYVYMANSTLQRATDMPLQSCPSGAMVYDKRSMRLWVCTFNRSERVGVDPLEWMQV